MLYRVWGYKVMWHQYKVRCHRVYKYQHREDVCTLAVFIKDVSLFHPPQLGMRIMLGKNDIFRVDDILQEVDTQTLKVYQTIHPCGYWKEDAIRELKKIKKKIEKKGWLLNEDYANLCSV